MWKNDKPKDYKDEIGEVKYGVRRDLEIVECCGSCKYAKACYGGVWVCSYGNNSKYVSDMPEVSPYEKCKDKYEREEIL